MTKGIPHFFPGGLFPTPFLAAIPPAFAADKAAATDRTRSDAKKESILTPLVRIDLLMIAMPAEKFDTLLPDLLDKNKIDRTVSLLLEAVKRKEMIMGGYPIVITKSGQRALAETYRELPDLDAERTAVAQKKFMRENPFTPVNFSTPPTVEVRNVGATMEVEPIVSGDGKSIDLNISAYHSQLLGFQSLPAPGGKEGRFSTDELNPFAGKPVFYTMNNTTSITLRDGQRLLLGIHKTAQPEGYVEIFILHAEILPSGL